MTDEPKKAQGGLEKRGWLEKGANKNIADLRALINEQARQNVANYLQQRQQGAKSSQPAPKKD